MSPGYLPIRGKISQAHFEIASGHVGVCGNRENIIIRSYMPSTCNGRVYFCAYNTRVSHTRDVRARFESEIAFRLTVLYVCRFFWFFGDSLWFNVAYYVSGHLAKLFVAFAVCRTVSWLTFLERVLLSVAIRVFLKRLKKQLICIHSSLFCWW